MHVLLTRNWLLVNCFLFNFLYPNPLKGQSLEEILTLIQIEEEEELLTDDELLALETLAQSPLDLNNATGYDLDQIPFLASEDARLILNARSRLGKFSTMEQVLSLPGLSLFTTLLLPKITTIKYIPPLKMTLRNRWVTSGNDVRMLTQGTFTQPSTSGGFLLERDPHEQSAGDFASAFFSINPEDNIRLILGDYQIIHGYGLLFGRSARTIKGQSSISQLTKPGKRIIPYRSAVEYWTLRGIAFEFTNFTGRWLFSLSASPKDATLDSNKVVSFATSGIHQTENSLSRKHNLREEIAIMSWGKEFNDTGELGILIAHDRYKIQSSNTVNPNSGSYGSIYGRVMLSNMILLGEIATDRYGKPSATGGYVLSEKNIRWIATIRYYTHGFQGPRSQPFREWSSNQLNEIGLFQTLSIKTGMLKFHTYGDVYHQHSPGNPSVKTIKGYETVAIGNYRWRHNQITFRWKKEEKTLEDRIIYRGDSLPDYLSQTSSRLNMTRTLSTHLRYQIQCDYSFITNGDSVNTGYGLSTKIVYNGKKHNVTFNWVGFVADDFASRIYIWDVNLPGELRSKSFFPTGQSIAFLFRIKTETNATLSVRIRSTWEFSRYTGNWYKPEMAGGFQMDIAL